VASSRESKRDGKAELEKEEEDGGVRRRKRKKI
jgi:hypothetical protein